MNLFAHEVLISLVLIQLLGIVIIAKKPIAVGELASAKKTR
jgi:hypothetical protein